MNIGDRVLATDRFGNYHKEPCTVTGFKTNRFGAALVTVKMDNGGSTVFYPSELQEA